VRGRNFRGVHYVPAAMPGITRLRGALAVAAAALALVTVASSANAAVRIGISDQNVSMFDNPLFAPLEIRYARYVTPWDVALKPDSLEAAALDQWLAAARAAGVQAMVAFQHSAGDNCPREPCTLPDPADFRRAFLAFRAKYPQIKVLSTWNEANHSTQPTYRDPVVAAQYYLVMRRHCRGCTIVAADVLDNYADHSQKMAKWLTTFSSVARSARLWGIHNWADTNRFTTDGIKAMLRAVKGDVWLTETGGIVEFTTQAGSRSFKPSDARAAKAMRYLFQRIVPISKRIKRVYVYNWLSHPTNRWDSGLIDHNGRKRQMYDVLKRYSTR